MTVQTKKAKVVIEDIQNTDCSDSDSIPASSHSDPHSEEELIDEESNALLNEGWADSIAKILRTNKPKKKKTLVLSKAKKLTDPIKKIRTEDYEISTADGQVKKEQTIVEEQNTDGQVKRKKKQAGPSIRIKPNILDKDRERTLQKIATKGVVQLFNAVKTQQNDINKKLNDAGPLDVRKEKVLKNIDKRAFLDVLMGEKSSNVDEELAKNNSQTQQIKIKETQTVNLQQSSWNVLRDDFLMSAKMKDWDKELENENSEKEMEIDEIESD